MNKLGLGVTFAVTLAERVVAQQAISPREIVNRRSSDELDVMIHKLQDGTFVREDKMIDWVDDRLMLLSTFTLSTQSEFDMLQECFVFPAFFPDLSENNA